VERSGCFGCNWNIRLRPKRAGQLLQIQSELLSPLETPHDTLAGDAELSGHLRGREAVVAHCAVAHPRPCRECSGPTSAAADLVLADREAPVSRYDQIPEDFGGLKFDLESVIVGQRAQDVGYELAGAEDPFIEGPRLAAPLQRRRRLPKAPTAAQASAGQLRPLALRETVMYELGVLRTGGLERGPEVGKDEVRVLPGRSSVAEQCRVATPGIVAEGVEVEDQMSAHGVQMDIANQLQEIGFLFDHDRLKAVLEEVSRAAVAAVETDRIASEKPAHYGGKRCGTGAGEQVEMVRDEAPGVHGGFGFGHQFGEPAEEIESISIVAEDLPAFDATGDDVVENAGRVEPRSSWHEEQKYRCYVYLSSIDQIFMLVVDGAYLRPASLPQSHHAISQQRVRQGKEKSNSWPRRRSPQPVPRPKPLPWSDSHASFFSSAAIW
jgi:hypothetical protein